MQKTRAGSRWAITVVALIAVFGLTLTGCKSSSGSSGSSGGSTHPAAASSTSCQQVGNVKFAKTKFVFHGGLAFGAFHRYLYKPFKAGSFKSGANGRVKALIKGGAAALFVVHELKYVKKDAEANKTLCKLVAPLDKAEATLSGMASKLKSGKASDQDVSQLNGVGKNLDSVQSDAGKAGVEVKDKNPPANLAPNDGN